METPSLSHLKCEDFEHVYEPAEDTFLLLDALEDDIEVIKNLKPTICLEVGSGSGCIITAVAKVLGHSTFYLATDLNERACLATKSTALANSVWVEVLRTNLVQGLNTQLHRKVDLLMFNPPYVVTDSSEVGGTGISAAWAGGINGREVIDRFLPYVPLVLSESGLFYLMALKENNMDYIRNTMAEGGFEMSIIKSRRCGREHLSVLRFSRK